ncbi:MAG: glycosyltransferase [Deltaproteobacteria bacterium]|nr:glycosyltransferase [Deltaproteobacteria bacterium]
MKIGLAIYNFDPKKGGAERYTYDLAGRLAAKGHEVVIFCARGVNAPGITLIPLNTIAYPRWLRNYSFALSHRSALHRVKPDVMLGYGNVFDLDVYQSHGGVQDIWMEREIASCQTGAERKIKSLSLRYSLNQAVQRQIEGYSVKKGYFQRIVAISDMVRDHMSAHYGIEKKVFDIVYNGVDTERFRPAQNMPSGPVTILFCAGNFRLKGLFPLIKALGNVVRQGKDVQLTIMGRGNKEHYRGLMAEEGVETRVSFIGEQSHPEEIYRRAHLLAHPTYYDACSLTTMEAMASGIPVITTRWNGASAFVSPDEGYVIDEPGNIPALGEAISALTDPVRRESMGKNARRKMESFTMNRNADEMEAVLTKSHEQKRKR